MVLNSCAAKLLSTNIHVMILTIKALELCFVFYSREAVNHVSVQYFVFSHRLLH